LWNGGVDGRYQNGTASFITIKGNYKIKATNTGVFKQNCKLLGIGIA